MQHRRPHQLHHSPLPCLDIPHQDPLAARMNHIGKAHDHQQQHKPENVLKCFMACKGTPHYLIIHHQIYL